MTTLTVFVLVALAACVWILDRRVRDLEQAMSMSAKAHADFAEAVLARFRSGR